MKCNPIVELHRVTRTRKSIIRLQVKVKAANDVTCVEDPLPNMSWMPLWIVYSLPTFWRIAIIFQDDHYLHHPRRIAIDTS